MKNGLYFNESGISLYAAAALKKDEMINLLELAFTNELVCPASTEHPWGGRRVGVNNERQICTASTAKIF